LRALKTLKIGYCVSHEEPVPAKVGRGPKTMLYLEVPPETGSLEQRR
jgi:hypothetical protein